MCNNRFKAALTFVVIIALFTVGCSNSDNPTTSQVSQNGTGDVTPDDNDDPIHDGSGEGLGDSSTGDDTSGAKGTWDLDRTHVIFGCSTGKDCIPSIQNPKFINVQSATHLEDDDLIYGLAFKGEVKAYPVNILDWHEVVNDDYSGTKVTITYCPLTGSGIAAIPPVSDERGGGGIRQFGVSGFLYNNNLIVYDRATDSNWSQMYLRCVNGILRRTPMRVIPLIQTSWKTWKKMFPSSLVMTENTGFDRNYDIFPYGNYKEVEGLLFPLTVEDRRLFFKELVYGIITDRFNPQAKTYRFSVFNDGARAINDVVHGEAVVVAGMQSADFYISYSRTLRDGTVLTFETKTENPSIYPFDLVDNEGTVWNLLGEAISGPRTGEKLIPTDSYNAYWFAWGAMFPGVPIYQ